MTMKTEDFEKLLQGASMRTPPPSWRPEILQQARRAIPATKSNAGMGTEWFSRSLGSAWREWLWPHPAAWASLAGLWAVSILFQWLTIQPTSRAESEPMNHSLPWLAWERQTQQQRWIGELIAWEPSLPSGPTHPVEPEAPHPALRPRSALESRSAALA